MDGGATGMIWGTGWPARGSITRGTTLYEYYMEGCGMGSAGTILWRKTRAYIPSVDTLTLCLHTPWTTAATALPFTHAL